jgi:hypothetical protein
MWGIRGFLKVKRGIDPPQGASPVLDRGSNILGLKDMMVVQETKLTSAGTAWDMTEQGR